MKFTIINPIIKYTLLLLILFSGCSADLYTKRLAMDHIKTNRSDLVINEYLKFSYAENEGMIFGLFNSTGTGLKRYILIGMTSVSILFVLFLVWKMRRLSFSRNLPFVIILAGAFANLIDRILYGGVVDFIHIQWPGLFNWPFLFNVADMLIVIGGVMLGWMLMRRDDVMRVLVE